MSDNVDAESHEPSRQRPRKSSLGIVSMILGIVAFMICWIPFVGFIGMPLSVVGLLLGIIGIIDCLANKKAGAAFAFAGILICAIAIWVPIGLYRGINAVRENFRAAAELRGTDSDDGVGRYWLNDAGDSSRSNDLVSLQRPDRDPLRPMPNAASKPSNSTDFSSMSNDELFDILEADEPKVHSADKPLVVGDVEIRITSVTVGVVPLTRIDGSLGESAKSHLSIKIEVKNLSTNRKIRYESFAGPAFSPYADRASLRDNFGNSYNAVGFKSLAVPVGRTERESIYPGKSIADVLLFEPPVDGIKFLDLELPLSLVEASGDARVRIPMSTLIHRSHDSGTSTD